MSRDLPTAIDAEQSVLGGLMLSNSSMAKLGDWLKPEHFFRDDHRAIFEVMVEASEAERPFDAVTLGEWFAANGATDEERNRIVYLLDLTSTTGSAANIVAYAEIVAERAHLRTLIDAGTALASAAFNPQGKRADELALEASQTLLGMSGSARARGPRSLREIGLRWYEELQERYNAGGGIRGIATPWGKLNAITMGLNAGDLVIVAGRPSMGKSALAVNLATSVTLRGKRAMFFNLEMTGESIFTRGIASVGNVPLSWLRAGGKGGDVDYWPATTAAFKALKDAPLIVDDTAGLTVQQIVSRAKREHLRGALDLVIIDHLHLIRLGKGDTVRELQEVTSACKALGKSLGCPVVMLSQLNRSLESRGDKHPQMSDLRESGAIEQDADLILFLYRDDYYAEREERTSAYPGWVELVVAKQREGETGKIWLRNDLAHARLDDYDGPAPDKSVSMAETKPRRMVNRLEIAKRGDR